MTRLNQPLFVPILFAMAVGLVAGLATPAHPETITAASGSGPVACVNVTVSTGETRCAQAVVSINSAGAATSVAPALGAGTSAAAQRVTLSSDGPGVANLATIATNTGVSATAANQTSQITQETAINTVLGTVTASPTANTIADRLKTLNTTLGSPLQAAGNIGTVTTVTTITNPVGITAQLDDTSTTACTEDQFCAPRLSTNRALLTRPFASAAQDWSYAAASGGIANTTTAVTLVAAVASTRNYITACTVSAGSLGAATEVAIRSGASGTVLWRVFVGTGGINANFEFPTPLKSAANTLLEAVTLTATITGGVYVNCQGYQAL